MVHRDVANTVAIEINFFMDNNNAKTVLHAKASGGVALSDLDDLEAVVQGWLTASWVPINCLGWTVQGITLTDLSSLTGPRKSYTISPPIQGTLTAQAMPASVTIAIKADVGVRGRGVAGRVFWVGLSEDQVQGNSILDTHVLAITTALNELNTLVTAMSQFDGLSIPHMTENKLPLPTPTSRVVTNFLATDNLVDVQKDRLPFHKKKRKPRITPTP